MRPFIYLLLCSVLPASAQPFLDRQTLAQSKSASSNLDADVHGVVKLLEDEKIFEESEERGEKGGNDGREEEEGGEEEGEEEQGEEEEGEEEEFTDADIRMSLMLLGGIAFIMALFYLVNHPDEEMKYYSWAVISSTISIFVAVLSFCSIDVMVDIHILEGCSPRTKTFGKGVQVLLYFTCLQITMAIQSTAVQCKCLENQAMECLFRMKGYDSQEAQRLYIQSRVKCYCTLLAHMTGFAAISFGGELQHGKTFEERPLLTFVAVPILFAGIALLARISRFIRESLKEEQNAGSQTSDMAWANTFWVEEVYETENDVIGLCVSFLMIQACRYNISGELPNNLGVEKDYPKGFNCITKLMWTSLLFAVCSVVLLRVSPKIRAKFPGRVVRRLMSGTSSAVSMSFAWALMYASKWQLAEYPSFGNPNFITARLMLALIISFIIFAIITVLDKLADSEHTDSDVDEAINTLIGSLGLVVGFSWEQSFDGAVEVLAETTGHAHVEITTFGLAALVCIVVVPAWRMYILPKVIRLHEEHVAKFSPKHDSTYTQIHAIGSGTGTVADRDSSRDALGPKNSGISDDH